MPAEGEEPSLLSPELLDFRLAFRKCCGERAHRKELIPVEDLRLHFDSTYLLMTSDTSTCIRISSLGKAAAS